MDPNQDPPDAGCWRCGLRAPTARLDVECVLRSRPASDGGPYLQWRCTGCGEDAGALRGSDGRWLLHPLEGLLEPGLLDRLVPRTTRESLDAAGRWWRRNAARVERFRRAAADARTRRPNRHEARPPPEPDAPTDTSTGTPTGERPNPGAGESPPAPSPSPRPDTARGLLGVADDASADDVRRAYRRALKLCHPDRVANLDPEFQALAHRKSKALRVAYESLIAQLG